MLIESRHRGAVAIVDAAGASALTLGDIDRAVFPRSAVKGLQALPLIETGAADKFGYGAEELALACASHSGEPGHVAVAGRMLARIGLGPEALECGSHWPLHQPSAHALVSAGRSPGAVHNNCSGKHAGFLAVSKALGVEHRSYVSPTHPVQCEVKATIEDMAGVGLTEDVRATDGCSVPTWAIPLRNLARAFARFATGQGVGAERAKAAARLQSACMANPYLVAGTGRFCTRLMGRFGTQVFAKGGAEGVYCGALPALGLGIAIKCDDGAGRAAEVVMAAVVVRLLALDVDADAALSQLVRPALRNWNGIAVGELRPSEALLRTP